MHTKLFLLWHKKKQGMAGCFEFRMRTSSFDLHQLAHRNRLAKIGNLFRSKSDEAMKTRSPSASPGGSPADSPRGSPLGSPGSQRRRRFFRVVKNEEAAGEEYENPHLIRRFTRDYLTKQYNELEKCQSLDDNFKLPYTVSGHTILKRHASVEVEGSPTAPGTGTSTPGDQSPPHKHASFREVVEVIEYDKKGKIITCPCLTHTEDLHDDDQMHGFEVIVEEHERVNCKRSEATKEGQTNSDDTDKTESDISFEFDGEDPTSSHAIFNGQLDVIDELDSVDNKHQDEQNIISSQKNSGKTLDTDELVNRLLNTHLDVDQGPGKVSATALMAES